MTAQIGAIHAELSAGVAAWQRDLGRATAVLGTNTARMNRMLSGVDRRLIKSEQSTLRWVSSIIPLRGAIAGLIGAGGAVGLTLLTKRTLEATSAIEDQADKIGIGVEALQEMRYAASQTGVAQDTLDMALQRFSRRVGEAANGGGELLGTLRQYGIAVTDADGRQRALTDVMDDYARAIQGASSDQERLRLAFKAFDSEGAALVNLLREGPAGMRQLRDEARRLGIVLDERMVAGAKAAADQLDRMERILGANLQRLMLTLAPTVERLGEAFADTGPQIASFINELLPAKYQPLDLVEKRILSLKVALEDLRKERQRIDTGRQGGLVGGSLGRSQILDRRINDTEAALAEMEKLADERRREARPVIRPTEIPIFQSTPFAGNQEAVDAVKLRAEAERQSLKDMSNQQRWIKQEIERGRVIRDQSKELQYQIRLQELRSEHLGQESGEYEVQARLLALKAQYGAEAAAAMEGDIRQLDALTRQTDQVQALADGFKEFGQEAVGALSGAIAGTEKFGDSLRRLAANALSRVGNRLLESAFTSIASSAASSLFGSGGGFGGFLAEGGPVTAGQTYLVGEEGPELFTSSRSGRIVPNDAMQGGGPTQVFNVDMRGASVEAVERLKSFVLQRDAMFNQRAVAAVADHRRRSGK